MRSLTCCVEEIEHFRHVQRRTWLCLYALRRFRLTCWMISYLLSYPACEDQIPLLGCLCPAEADSVSYWIQNLAWSCKAARTCQRKSKARQGGPFNLRVKLVTSSALMRQAMKDYLTRSEGQIFRMRRKGGGALCWASLLLEHVYILSAGQHWLRRPTYRSRSI